MSANENLKVLADSGMPIFTPAMLAERKLTLGDLPPSVYDHETQTRKFPDGEIIAALAPDTRFDGESS
jgi:hypothetical protein